MILQRNGGIFMELKGSKTEANLLAAFAGESQARNKYTYFASKARKEGYTQIAELFQQTADNEKEHAKIWFVALARLQKIWKMLQTAKIMNGQTCMLRLQKKQKKKALTILRFCLKALPQLKKSMKNATELCLRTLRKAKSLKRPAYRFGNAEIAVIL